MRTEKSSMTVQEFRDLKVKKAKYRNIKIVRDGIKFDSIKEADRYTTLRMAEKANKITNLECQKEFIITINGKTICSYFSDFSYNRNEGSVWPYVVEDVKSDATRTNAYYRLKKKLVEAQFGIKIIEV